MWLFMYHNFMPIHVSSFYAYSCIKSLWLFMYQVFMTIHVSDFCAYSCIPISWAIIDVFDETKKTRTAIWSRMVVVARKDLRSEVRS